MWQAPEYHNLQPAERAYVVRPGTHCLQCADGLQFAHWLPGVLIHVSRSHRSSATSSRRLSWMRSMIHRLLSRFSVMVAAHGQRLCVAARSSSCMQRWHAYATRVGFNSCRFVHQTLRNQLKALILIYKHAVHPRPRQLTVVDKIQNCEPVISPFITYWLQARWECYSSCQQPTNYVIMLAFHAPQGFRVVNCRTQPAAAACAVVGQASASV